MVHHLDEFGALAKLASGSEGPEPDRRRMLGVPPLQPGKLAVGGRPGNRLWSISPRGRYSCVVHGFLMDRPSLAARESEVRGGSP
jgi:hypothetical protein